MYAFSIFLEVPGNSLFNEIITVDQRTVVMIFDVKRRSIEEDF